ncbi:MAG: hypothetical protein U1E46_17535 [Hyphomicrobiales bacterium]
MPILNHRSLILVYDAKRQGLDDFKAIATKIRAKAPDIAIFVVRAGDNLLSSVPPEAWNMPTFTVSFGPTGAFRPPRGPVAASHAIDKVEQYRRFVRAGIRTPRTSMFAFGMPLAPAEWSEFVILKPADFELTSHGDCVHLLRTEDAAAAKPVDFPADHPIQKGRMLIQSFVDTGPKPSKYRVLTLFGEVLYAQHVSLAQERPPLDAGREELAKAVVSTGGGEREYTFTEDPAILDVARAMARAFPGLPLLGCDIIRDWETGDLHALEINGGGNVWHFSSPWWAEQRRAMPHVARMMVEQFDAFDVAARTLIKATRAHAR